MNKQPRLTWILIVLLGLLTFALFCWPNSASLGREYYWQMVSTDEAVTYPIVEKMLTFDPDWHVTWGRLIIYEDYHYGYPFYFLSMLALLPLRLIEGTQFFLFENKGWNLLVLRMMISVLPMILAAGVFTYLQTRFRSALQSAALFILLLSVPAVARTNVWWWHPDALAILAVALAILFLDRDRFRLGPNFYLAALACGFASAIKLLGFWMFLAIALYLGVGLWQKKVGKLQTPLAFSWKRVFFSGLGFIGLMSLTIVLCNPFLFYEKPRQKMFEIQASKSLELQQGYTHDAPEAYQKGPYYWRWTLRTSYADLPVLAFLAVSLLAGCFSGERRLLHGLIAAWMLPLGVYLLWFVAPKPDHYLLPVLMPLYSAIFSSLPLIQKQSRQITANFLRYAVNSIAVLSVYLVWGYQVYWGVMHSLGAFFEHL